MSDDKKRVAADAAYKKLIETMDEHFSYEKDDTRRCCTMSASTDDIDIKFDLYIEEPQQVLRLVSCMPFKFPRHKLAEGCLAAAYATSTVDEGGFFVDIQTGKVYFKSVISFRDCPLSHDSIIHVLTTSYSQIDSFNDKFWAIATEKLSIDDFISED